MASSYEILKRSIEFYGKNKELMDNMQYAHIALEEQAVEALLANAHVTEKETGFNELIN
ncbi:MAG: Trigger factor [Sodalis sp.]|nr:MAG: Trigger factor [Sodalis sp.]